VVYDLLASLAEEIARLNKEKQAEAQRFLDWLESYIGAPIEELMNKTRLREYWKPEVTWERFRDVLVQNKGRITKVKLPGYQAEQPIRDSLVATRGKLQPILDRIERTDWLVDHVIYKLHGLAKEEIAVVEGRASQ